MSKQVHLIKKQITERDIESLKSARNIRICECTYPGDWNLIAKAINKCVVELEIRGCDINDSFLQTLKYLPQLRVLELGKNQFTNKCAKIIQGMFQTLDGLYLEGNPPKIIGTNTFKEILYSRKFSKIKRFILQFQISKLRFANEGGNIMSSKQMRSVMESFTQLKQLSIGSCQLQAQHADILVRGLKNLEYLDINSNYLLDEGAAFVSNLAELKFLSISGNKIKDRGAKALARGLNKLQSLDICANQLGKDGYIYITRGMPELKTLYIDTACDEVIFAIAQNLKNLNWLKILFAQFKVSAFKLFLHLRNLRWMNNLDMFGDDFPYIASKAKTFLPSLQLNQW